MKNYKKNKILLEKTFNYTPEMEHDACGVGLIATTDGKKTRKVVEYGIEALKAIWHRGAVDADGKSGDGAGIQIEIAPEFFKKKFWRLVTPPMIKKEFASAWSSCQGQIIQSKKNVER
jgi:glutamate synthase (NADPH/NADH) large chain